MVGIGLNTYMILHVYYLLGISTPKNVKCCPTMTKVRICLKSGSGWSLASHWCETNAALPKSSLKATSSPPASEPSELGFRVYGFRVRGLGFGV